MTNSPRLGVPVFAQRVLAFALLGPAVSCGQDAQTVKPAANSAGASPLESPAGATSGGTGGGNSAAPNSTGGTGDPSPADGGSQATSGGAAGHGAGSAGQAQGGTAQAGSGGQPGYARISFGTALDPLAQVVESQKLAQSLAAPTSATWRAKGDQHRTYRFPGADQDIPYRVCVPADWDGTTPLSLVMFLHGANNDESSYLDQNGKQLVKLAAQHRYVLVSPLGYEGAYGTFLRLPAVFGKPDEAEKLLAARTVEAERKQELSEKDVINVLELVLNEYPIDRSRMFLTGHSMGSGGTWYIGGKYSAYWAALAPMSGPFVLEHGYPWQNLRSKPVFVTEGLASATVAASHALRDWLTSHGYPVTYQEVNADHAGMVPLVLPEVFTFFDQAN